MNLSGASGVDWTANSLLNLKTESSTSLHYRDDFQVMTTNVYYGTPGGLALVSGTYHVFGNNGATAYKGSVGAGNSALTNLVAGAPISPAQLYADLTTASDHLPVVADYTVPLPHTLSGLGIAAAVLSGAGGFQFSVTNTDGTPITADQLSRIAIYGATDPSLVATNWTPLSGSTLLTNGVLQVNDTNSDLYPRRFYRAVEAP
jgi:hypothetical protein